MSSFGLSGMGETDIANLGSDQLNELLASADAVDPNEFGIDPSSIGRAVSFGPAAAPPGAPAFPMQTYTQPGPSEDGFPTLGTVLPPDNVENPNVLQLMISNHSVHKILNQGTPDQEYVVSNLRKFTIDVMLVDRRFPTDVPEAVQSANMALKATLLYENGNVVRQTQEHEQLLQGDTEIMVIAGKGQFQLKMGLNALSNKLGKQRFRIKIVPKDEALQRIEHLTVMTEPLRSVTKLERKPANARQQAPPPPEPSDPGGPLFGAAAGSNVEQLQRELAEERAMRTRITRQLEEESTEAAHVKEVMRQQQEQIKLLNESNAHILEELKTIRTQMRPS